MKLAVAVLAILITMAVPEDGRVQFSGHRSRSDLERMTPEQRVEEYCREYLRHGLVDTDYRGLIKTLLRRDGQKAAPNLARIIDEYDPTRRQAAGDERARRAYACITLLPQLDATAVRLRASEEGRRAIEAMRTLLNRMQAARFDTDENYDRRNTYEILVFSLKELEGINQYDEAIRNTLKIQYGISLSDDAFLSFVNYLIQEDAHYPVWSDGEEYKHPTERNEAGNPIWYTILKTPEPFHKAYLRYKFAYSK